MTNRDAIEKMYDLVKQRFDLSVPVQAEAKSPEMFTKMQLEHALWGYIGTILKNIEFTVNNDTFDKNTALQLLSMTAGDLEKKFVYGDDAPMSDDEFLSWHTMLWNAMWNDKDERFKGKTVGEMWDILIKEENFPKKRFYNELDRRGMLPSKVKASVESEETKHSCKLTKEFFNEFVKFAKEHHWVVFFGEQYTDGVFMRSNRTAATAVIQFGATAMFYGVNGDWYIKTDISNPHEPQISRNEAMALMTFNNDDAMFERAISPYGWVIASRNNSVRILIQNTKNPDSVVEVCNNDLIGIYRASPMNASVEDREFEIIVLEGCKGG